MKKINISFCLKMLVVVFVLAALIALITSHCVPDNALTYGPLVIGIGVVALLASIVYAFIGIKMYNKSVVVYMLGLAVSIANGAMIGLMIFERSWLTSAIFTWDPYNYNGWTAFYISVASVGLYLLAEVILIISGFVGDCKDK